MSTTFSAETIQRIMEISRLIHERGVVELLEPNQQFALIDKPLEFYLYIQKLCEHNSGIFEPIPVVVEDLIFPDRTDEKFNLTPGVCTGMEIRPGQIAFLIQTLTQIAAFGSDKFGIVERPNCPIRSPEDDKAYYYTEIIVPAHSPVEGLYLVVDVPEPQIVI